MKTAAIMACLALSGCTTNYLLDYNVRAGVKGSVYDLGGKWAQTSKPMLPEPMTTQDLASFTQSLTAMQNLNVVFKADK